MAVDIQQFRNFTGQSRAPFTRTVTANNVGFFRPVAARNADQIQAKIVDYTADQRGDSQTLIFPEEEIKYFVNLEYSTYSRISPQRVGFTRKGSIYLPLPVQGMTDTHEVDYIEETMGLVGTAAQIAQNLFGTGADQSQGGILGSLQELFSRFLTGIPGVSSFFGASPNKFMTILLKGPRYKRHEFTWKLYPTSKRESLTIARIITQMNNAMAPGLTVQNLLFTFPYIFFMQYVPNAKYLYKFKPMVLESMTTNYAAPGVPSFYADPARGENPPEMIEIRARFLELEYWLRNQYNLLSNAGPDGIHRDVDQAESGLREIFDDVGAFVGLAPPQRNPVRVRNRIESDENPNFDQGGGDTFPNG